MKCETCGHSEEYHYSSKQPAGRVYMCHKFDKKYCGCQQFILSENKGCVEYLEEHEEVNSCPSCSNHSSEPLSLQGKGNHGAETRLPQNNDPDDKLVRTHCSRGEPISSDSGSDISLSDKVKNPYHFTEETKWIYVEDVKEFIRLEQHLIGLWMNGHLSHDEFWNERDKLAGEFK